MTDALPDWLLRLLDKPTRSWSGEDWRNAVMLMCSYWDELPAGWSPAGMGLLVSGSIIGTVERKVLAHGRRIGRPAKQTMEQAAKSLESLEDRRERIARDRGVSVCKVTYKEAIEEIVHSSPESAGIRKDKQRALVRAMQSYAKSLKKKIKPG